MYEFLDENSVIPTSANSDPDQADETVLSTLEFTNALVDDSGSRVDILLALFNKDYSKFNAEPY
ncbi:MAG: hypothetical protein VW397_08320, partial [Candidatus Margulisiibacteriota bacterium]